MGKNLPNTQWLWMALLTAAVVPSCDPGSRAASRAHVAADVADSMGATPTAVSIIRTRARPELVENSAAAMSATQPGVFFTINDSGNEPVLFAMDTTGADRGAWPLRGARNVDWESAAIGPCGSGHGVADCVYVGDTGDNHARHKTRSVYRVREPAANGRNDSLDVESLTYVYSDGPHDVEAMYVAANGDMFFITKRQSRTARGSLRPALVFQITGDAWRAPGRATAQLVDSLPTIIPGSALLRVVTDASLAPDGRHLAVRTYSQVYIVATDAVTGRIIHSVPPSVCNITSLGEAQGEGVTWATSAGRLVFTSEGHTEPIRIANCPLPRG